MAKGTPAGARRGAYRRAEEPARPHLVPPELAAIQLSPAEVFVTLAALVCDPDDYALGVMARDERTATDGTALGTLLGNAIANAVYGKG